LSSARYTLAGHEERIALREQLRALIKLAEIDAQARGIDERLKGIPAELEERRSALRALEALVERQRSTIAEAERLLVQQDSDIAGRNEALSKAKAKSAKARTMREAEAAERELDAIRRSIKEGDTEKENLRARITQTRTGLEAPEATLEEQRQELAAAEMAAESKLSELRVEREKVVVGRDEWAKKIDKQFVRLYDRLRTKLVPAVCEVAGETCSGCRMKMAPQRFLQLKRGTDIMQCQMCNRIVYHRDILAD
jgi:predicted  nucleic acid-binding Zn-ribbon protein